MGVMVAATDSYSNISNGSSAFAYQNQTSADFVIYIN